MIRSASSTSTAMIPFLGARARAFAVALILALSCLAPLAVTHAQETPSAPTFAKQGQAVVQFTWLFDRINGGAANLADDEIADHFTPRFVEAIGKETITTRLQSAATDLGPFTITAIIQETDDLVHVQTAARDGSPVVIAVSIEHSDGKIAGFIIQPGTADLPASPSASPSSSPVASPRS